MTTQRLGLIMNGVTGRMGLNQHLIRSIVAIRDSGGVRLANGDRVMPDPILVGRDPAKVEALAKRFGVERWTTDLDGALSDKKDAVFFDAATTAQRAGLITQRRESRQLIYSADFAAMNDLVGYLTENCCGDGNSRCCAPALPARSAKRAAKAA